MKSLIDRIFPGYKRLVALLVAFALTLSGTVLLFPDSWAYALGNSGSGLGDSDGSIGYSNMVTIGISSAQELFEISKRVNSGESFSNKIIELNADIQLQEVREWVPLGMSDHPFTGVFDGKGNTVRGIVDGDAIHSTLFGSIEEATVKNTTLAVRCDLSLRDLDSYLFVSSVKSTIENCKVELDYYYPARARAKAFSLGPDTRWYYDHLPLKPNYALTTPEELWGLAVIVNNEDPGLQQSFPNVTITIPSELDLGGISSWEPIGTALNPFEGDFESAGSGSKVSNLKINNAALNSAGLFGHVLGGKIEKIQVIDAQVSGTNNVGILVGHATNTDIIDCYTTGTVSGIAQVGGLAGVVNDTLGTPDTVRAEWCYSTAEVSGTSGVGGLVGLISNDATVQDCFATGNVGGVVHVGGIAGEVFPTVSTTLLRIASSGRVSGSGSVGGLIGVGNGNILAESSYTSSRVDALSDSGGIIGTNGNTCDSYTSGQIYGLNDLLTGQVPGYKVSPTVGHTGSGGFGVYYTYFNYDARAQMPGEVQINDLDFGNLGSVVFYFFPNSGPADTSGLSSAFTGNSLVGHKPGGQDRIPVSGSYPQLNAFNGKGGAFAAFSEVSTAAELARIPDTAVFNNGYLANESDTVDITLSTVGGLIQWSIVGADGNGDYVVYDPTVPNEKNVIQLSGGKLAMDYKAASPISIMLEGKSTVPGLESLVIKKVINIKDEAVRPILSTLNKALYSDNTGDGATDDGFPNDERLTVWDQAVYIEFPEPLIAPGVLPSGANLTRYSDGWGSATTTRNVNYTLLNDTLLKVDWAPQSDFVGYDKRLKISIPTTLGIKDEAGNTLDLTYYFMSVRNLVTKLSFANMPGQVSISNDEDEQTIRMLIDDPSYNTVSGYLEGILSENESPVTVTASDVVFAAVQSAFGTEAFPAQPGDTVVDETNFYKYPGIYTFTYQVDDPEDPSVRSNAIVRTYDVTDKIKDWFFANGRFGETHLDEFRPIIMIDGQSAGEILLYGAGATSHDKLIADLNKRLAELHKATIASQSTGQEVLLPISYDFSNIPATAFEDGFSGYIYYGIDGAPENNPLFIQIESIFNRCEIVTKYDVYMCTAEEYRTDRALEYFDPSLRRIGTPRATYIPATWSLEGTVALGKLNEGQIVTIKADNVYGVAGYTLTKDVIVMIVDEDRVPTFMKNREKNVDTHFWERIEVQINQSKPGTVIEARVLLSVAYAPRSVFETLARKDDVTLRIIQENDIVTEICSDDVVLDKVKSESDVFNVIVESIQDLDVNRDARGIPVQQFFAKGYYQIPAKYTLSIPLTDGMKAKIKDQEELTLYLFDMETGLYKTVQSITERSVKNGTLTIDMNTIDGEYVIY